MIKARLIKKKVIMGLFSLGASSCSNSREHEGIIIVFSVAAIP
jgi:hypothetical protein